MSLRTKTLEYAFTTRTTSLGAATSHEFSAITLTIPENTSRTFRSVFAEVTVRDNLTTAQSMSTFLIGVQLAAVAFSDVTSITDTIANTGEHQGLIFQSADMATYFNTNFGSGTTQTCKVHVTFGTSVLINVTCKLIITYEWDDASQTTRARTVKIPLDSTTAVLTTTLTEVGTNQIPDLDAILLESTKVYKNIWLEIEGTEGSTSTGNFTFGIQIDSGTEETAGTTLENLNSGCWFRYISIQDAIDTTNAHALKLRTATTAAFSHPVIRLCVTYTYDHSASTSIMNYIAIPLESTLGHIVGTTSADKMRLQSQFFIEEPVTIALAQSGIELSYTQFAAFPGLTVACGGQTARVYTDPSSNECGTTHLSQRIDSGGAQGAGITLARGENTLVVDIFTTGTAANSGYGLTGMLHLLYSSAKHASGDAVHNHTTQWLQLGTGLSYVNKHGTSFLPPVVPETSYYVNSFGGRVATIQAPDNGAIAYAAEVLSGEERGAGFRRLWGAMSGVLAEIGAYVFVGDYWDAFKRNPGDPNPNRLALETSRTFRHSSTKTLWAGYSHMLTYHGITFTAGGSVSGYTGDGSGITVDFFRADTREWIGSATTAAGGTYTFTWYDNTVNVYGSSRQDGTHLGRSDSGVAV